MNPFETETMAELCLRQGHRDEALAIYTRLLSRTNDPSTRARLEDRIVEIETAPAEQKGPPRTANEGPGGPPLAAPGIRSRVTDDVAIVEWSLPTATAGPTVELLLVARTPSGVTTERRSVPVNAAAGRMVLSVPGLHSLRAAAGFTAGDRFVPLART
jgi:hypothetical protein